MGVAGNLAKRAAKAAGNAAVRKINGGCPGSKDGKHKFTAGGKGLEGVSYCKNKNCGLVHR